MPATPDHLIERAAALLQSGGRGPEPAVPLADGGRMLDHPRPEPAAPGQPVSSPPPRLAASMGAMPAAVPFELPPSGANPVPQPPAPGTTPASAAAPSPALAAPPSALPAPGILASTAPISVKALEQAGMVMARNSRSRISEEYRIVVGRVLRALRTDAPSGNAAQNALMVTSARPGEGKSFSALNLAGSIAKHGTDKVLLVDLDAKLRPMSSQLGVGERLGFQDLVNNSALRPEDLVLQTELDNLLFLPVGSRVSNTANSTITRPVPPTVTRLARRFPKHVLVLDAPPCLSTSDPHTIAPYVGQVVMVVEAERTQRTEIEAAIELVRVCPNITILLNKVRLTTSYTFGAYDYYGSYT